MRKRYKAPAHLKPATKLWWLSLHEDFELEEHHSRLATLAGESWDRCVQAREALAADGLTFRDDRGNIRPHPLLTVEKDSRIAFARLVRELDLDIEPPSAGSSRRPPGLRSNAGGR